MKFFILSKHSDKFIALHGQAFKTFCDADNYLQDYLMDTYKQYNPRDEDDYVIVNEKYIIEPFNTYIK